MPAIPSPPDPSAPPRVIGAKGQPIRAIGFSSGGFDTAMDLGVIHALLVIHGKAPDAVVGNSAGAINAVALAEVLQARAAGPNPTPTDTLLARVTRFREILEAYANAPADLAGAYLPDTHQVDAGRPLEPLRQPIHYQREWEGRDDQLHARQGMVRLFNFLLRTRLSFATLTRFVRRCLGIRAASQVLSPWRRGLAQGFEAFRSWSLIGLNLPRLTGIALEVVARPFFRSSSRTQGASAAWILFQPRWARAVGAAGLYALAFWALVSIWMATTWLIGSSSWWLFRQLLGQPPVVIALAAVVVLGLAWWTPRSTVWRQLTMGQRTQPAPEWLVRELLGPVFEVAILFSLYLGAAVVLVMGAVAAWSGWGAVPDWQVVAGWISQGMGVTMAVVAGVLLLRWQSIRGSYRRRFLEQFDLADALLSRHPLRDTFVRLFDRGYYGPRNMDDVVERSLRDDDRPSDGSPRKRLLEDYATAEPSIEVGLMVANAGTGDLEVIAGRESVVDGLCAATAATPWLPPARVTGKLLLDGANIATEPTPAVLELLRGRTHPDAPVVHIYSVSPLPFSSPTLRDETAAEDGVAPVFSNIVDMARRALLLERFRDASLARRVTEIYTKSLTPGAAAREVDGEPFLRAWVTPVEPDEPLDLNGRLFEASTREASRGAIGTAVAEGCRAALQVMTRASQPGDRRLPIWEGRVTCRTAVEAHRQGCGGVLTPLPADLDSRNPPTDRGYSGLAEVCRYCCLPGRPDPAKPEEPPKPDRHQLHYRRWAEIGPAWPCADTPEQPLVGDPRFRRPATVYEQRTDAALRHYKASLAQGTDTIPQWPVDRGTAPGQGRPLVSLLFSGGVFRGVYQLGTLNALGDLGVRPDIVAGASIGSITAAMAAQTLSFEGAERQARIARLAATYLAIDRLILTDRFADFIRGFTLRAGASQFSLAEADRTFRRYDLRGATAYSREARRVVAGLERLFWLSPFELLSLLKAIRLGNWSAAGGELKAYVQEWLDRMGVGREILGAEPLALLIAEHVLQPLPGQPMVDARTEPFDRFLAQGIYFLATTTNLSAGRLEVLGEQQFAPDALRPSLLEGLLASSAFPAVFRPRWSWEVVPGSSVRHQYIDGGVMDNLPLDGVVHFIRDASDIGLIARHPEWGGQPVPHLLFGASLEPAVPEHRGMEDLEELTRDWMALRGRAGTLRYNKKLELYAKAQTDLRRIRQQNPSAPWQSIDLEVVTATPQWLVGTFAFHPMLGFNRDKQAGSIAHGCATALATFSDQWQDPARRPWLEAWQVNQDRVPRTIERDAGAPVPGSLSKPQHREGRCWFREGCRCPFSRAALEDLPRPGLPPTTVEEVDRIYQLCGRAETHRALT